MVNIAANLTHIHTQIIEAKNNFASKGQRVELIAVSKTRTVAEIEQAIAAGQRHFGENYLQEALSKITQLAHQQDLVWHFIGPIQSNKTREIAGNFDWVHSVDRLKIAERLSQQRPVNLSPLNICIQINIDNEPTKSGVTLGNLLSLAVEINRLPRLHLRGLMAIPRPQRELTLQRQCFRRVRSALESLQRAGLLELDTLSMGMSDDFVAAIAEGATFIRLGTAIFGERV
ncbi:MAG: YggS family pyridoxal phosphate-dependent enzyme [Gammaproteobacteria bacterium]